jgi:hypothetical protein
MAAATVVIKELNGGTDGNPATWTTTSSTATSWFRVSDAHGNSSPSEKIPIPASGQNYSYWKQYVAEITANGDGNSLDNWKFYYTQDSDWEAGGKVGAAGGLKVGYSGSTYGHDYPTDYDVANGQMDSNGWAGEVITDHGEISSAVNMPTTATAFDGTLYGSTGTTNLIVLQLYVDTDATLGTIGACTAHIQYDES